MIVFYDLADKMYGLCFIKGVLQPWTLFLKMSCIFLKNKATLDKLSNGSDRKCSKELKKSLFYFSRDYCCEVTVKDS